MRIQWLPIALALLGSTASAQDTFTCRGGWSASVGMHAQEVQSRCGDPHDRQVVRVPIRKRGADGSSYVDGYARLEYWTYGSESDRRRTVLTFELSTLRRIGVVKRGEAPPIL